MKDILKIRLAEGYLNLLENAEEDFFVTRQVHQIQDLQTRNGDVSRSMTIPRDRRNVALLGYNLPSFKDVFTPYQSYIPCAVEFGGLPVLNDSLIFIVGENLTAQTIEIEVLGSQVLFFTLLKEDLISELEFPTVEWTLQGLAGRTNAVEGFGYGNAVWIDNDSIGLYLKEKEGENNEYVGQREVEASGGWFFFHTLFDRILEDLEEQGLIFDKTILEQNLLFQEMVFLLPVTQLYDNYNGLTPMYSVVTNIQDYGYGGGIQRPRFDAIESEDPDGLWDNSVASPLDRGFTLTENGLISVDLYSDMRVNEGGDQTAQMYYEFFLNGISIHKINIPLRPNELVEVQRRDTLTFNGTIGDFFYWQVTAPNGRGFVNRKETVLKLRRQQGEFGSTVFVHEWFPEISQKDFVREVLKFFHIVPVEHDRKVTFKYWDKIAEQENQDLTPFLDDDQGVELRDYVEGYGQQNVFEYSVPDVVVRDDTDHEIAMNKRLVPEKVTLIQSKFAPCDQTALTTLFSDSLRACSPLFTMEYEHVDDNKIVISAGDNFFEMLAAEKPHNLEVGDHLFVWDDDAGATMKRKVITILDDYSGYVDVDWDTQKDQSDWDFIKYTKTGIQLQIGQIFQGTGNGDIWDGGLYQGMQVWKDVRFANALRWRELVAQYYNNFAASVFNSVMGSVWLNIPLIDFLMIDFMRPVYISREKFYLNILEQYKTDGSVRAELFRLVNSVQEFTGGAFTVEPVIDANLGDWLTGDAPLQQLYTIENTGAINLNVSGVMSGSEGHFFSVDPPVFIPIGGTETMTVYFNGSTVGGNNVGACTFLAQGASSHLRTLRANVLTIAYTVEPSSAQHLGTWYEGDPALEQDYTIRNTGTSPITLTGSLETASTGYELTGTNPITLQPNETAIQTVLYNGNLTDEGSILCNLRYVESLAILPDVLRGISVQVLGIEFAVEPVGDVDLGDWNAGDPPLDQIYNVSNIGGRTTEVTAVFSGTGFSLVGTNPMTIPPKQSAQITFRFSGQPLGAVYNGFVDFINGLQLDVRRNARANVPAVDGLTVVPVEPVFMEWDKVSALPQTTYRWTNTGNTNHSSVNAQIDNTSHVLVGYGQSHTFDLAVGEFLDIPVGWNGGTVVGLFPSEIRTYLFGGLFAQNDITTEVLGRAYTVEPVGSVNLGTWYEGDPPLEQAYTVLNTGKLPITLNWSLETTNPDAWQLVGTNPITLQPTESAIQTIRYIGNAVDIGDVLANLRYVESTSELPDVLRGLQVRVLGIEFAVEPVDDVHMGDWNAGDPPLDQVYTINNIGGRTTTVTAAFSGTGFSLVGTNPNTIPPKQSAQITFRFSGQPLGAVYDGFVDFINGIQANVRRNARANVPAQSGLTIEPVADQSMTWDAIAARPTTTYRWTNTGNTNWSSLNAQLTNTSHTFVGFGQSHTFDLAVGAFLDITVRYEGLGTIGTYSSVIETRIFGGLYASNNIATTVQSSRLSVNPQSTQALDYVTNTVTLSWEVHNTGNLVGTFDLSKSSGSVYWVYTGAAQVVVQPSEHYVAIMQFNAPTGDSNHGTNVVGVFQALNNAYGESQERNNTMRVPKLRLDPANIPDLGTINPTETVIHQMKNPTAAQITGTGYLEDDFGGSLLLVLDSYILNPSQQINRHVRYVGGNSGQKLVTVVYVDDATGELAKISFYVTTIG